ncbi:hypothetical protein VPHD164_0056 [Vibrio phage D164]
MNNKLSAFEFFAIADNCKGLLNGAQGFVTTFNNGYHGIALLDKYGTSKQILDKSWADYTDQVKQLNTLLIQGK